MFRRVELQWKGSTNADTGWSLHQSQLLPWLSPVLPRGMWNNAGCRPFTQDSQCQSTEKGAGHLWCRTLNMLRVCLKPGTQFIPTGDPAAVLMVVVNKVGFPRRLDSCENKKAWWLWPKPQCLAVISFWNNYHIPYAESVSVLSHLADTRSSQTLKHKPSQTEGPWHKNFDPSCYIPIVNLMEPMVFQMWPAFVYCFTSHENPR